MYSLPPYFAACYSILLPSLLPPPSSFILFLFFYFPSPPPLDCCCLPPSFFLPPLLFPPRSSLLLYYAFPLLSSPLIGGEGGRGSILLVYLNTWCLRSYLPLPSLVLPPLLPLSPSPSRIPSPLPCASTCSYSCSSTSLFPFFLSLLSPFPFSLPCVVPYTFFFHNGISRSLILASQSLYLYSALHPQHNNNYLFTCNYQMEKLEIIPKNDT